VVRPLLRFYPGGFSPPYLEHVPAFLKVTSKNARNTGNCGFANSPELSQQPRPELLVKKIFPNRKTLLSGKKIFANSPKSKN
jgi:hypothetical protein